MKLRSQNSDETSEQHSEQASCARLSDLGRLLVNGLLELWPSFEQILLLPSSDPDFENYLEQYRGYPHNLGQTTHSDLRRAEFQQAVGEGVTEVFQKLAANSAVLAALEALFALEAPVVAIGSALSELEQAVNLALYHWCGLGNRNFQFRTLVHYCNLEGVGASLISYQGHDYCVSFSENGLRFGPEESNHIPLTAPVSRALALNEFTVASYRQAATAPQEVQLNYEARLLARIRSVQREICLVVGEWEHRNAILAIEHTNARDALRLMNSPEKSAAVLASSEKMTAYRDFLASWCLQAFVDFQSKFSELRALTDLGPDVHDELDAADAVLLSSVQKIFLPASVSRHRYHPEVARKALQWCEARLNFHHDDVSTQLARLALQMFLGVHSGNFLIPKFLTQKPFEWQMAFDPCTPLKAFCWKLSAHTHIAMCAFAAIALARKLQPQPLDMFWLSSVASLVQMPDTFPPVAKTETAHLELKPGKESQLTPELAREAAETLSMADANRLYSQVEVIFKAIPESAENAELLAYLRSQFNFLRGTQA